MNIWKLELWGKLLLIHQIKTSKSPDKENCLKMAEVINLA
jgi:hypothetical protein